MRLIVLTLGELTALDRRLRASIVTLNKRGLRHLTLIEAIDEAGLWETPFESLIPFASKFSIEHLLDRVPALVCGIAAEIGFRFEGVGTIFWARFEDALGLTITPSQRHDIGAAFKTLIERYELARPSSSAFSEHFSIIAWPIANALLPTDIVAPLTRLMARGPVQALPGRGRAPSFQSLRAWASAAEGVRLVDWLRLEAPAERVLSALLTENRGRDLPETSYRRLQEAIQNQPEAFFATRSARNRVKDSKEQPFSDPSYGRLLLVRKNTGLTLFVSWPHLSSAVFEEARSIARARAWRPRLWGAGPFFHPDHALSAGPIQVSLQQSPNKETAAYPDAADVFGSGSEIASTLAARTVAWESTLIFDVSDDKEQGEQKLAPLSGREQLLWIAVSKSGANLTGLSRIGSVCGYDVFEADVTCPTDRAILVREQLLLDQGRLMIVRHPSDAIGSRSGSVRAARPFLLTAENYSTGYEPEIRALGAGVHNLSLPGVTAQLTLRVEPGSIPLASPVEILVFDRESAFEALLERRLQIRVESQLPLINVLCSAVLEVDGAVIAHGSDYLATLPTTIDPNSTLLSPLYEDTARAKLLARGHGQLRLSIGKGVHTAVSLRRAATSVEWTDDEPVLVGAQSDATLVMAPARSPHRFTPTSYIAPPNSGAAAFGLLLTNGRIADPIRVLTAPSFDLGDLSASFGRDIGSRRLIDEGRGIAELARARVAWARGLCTSLRDHGARSRIVRQFDEALIVNLCGREWYTRESATAGASVNSYRAALWRTALDHGRATLPLGLDGHQAVVFERTFQEQFALRDPIWPSEGPDPIDGSVDDALNEGFSNALQLLQAAGELQDMDDDFDFGWPQEDWNETALEAIERVERSDLVALIAPTTGADALRSKIYDELTIPELAEDLAAWTREWALPRGQLSAEDAAQAIHLWLSPAVCDDPDGAVRVIANDPFVARAVRYAAIRLGVRTSESQR